MDDLKIKSFIEKRNDYFILNNYELLNIDNHDFNLIVYYLYDYKIKIIIRKFNLEDKGWNKQLILKLYNNYENDDNKNDNKNDNNDDNNDNEMIIIGSSKKNWKIFNYKTKNRVYKKEYKNIKIPKIIHQTYSNNNYHNISHYNAVQSLLEFNPDFCYVFYNDIDCRHFIKINYNNEILNCYDRIYPVAYKADLFRYLIMYKYGGIYLDNKYILRKSFYSIINTNDSTIFCKDINDKLLLNSILLSESNNDKFKLLIDKIINNVENNFYGMCPLHPTGPRLFYEYFNKENIKLNHKIQEPKKKYINCSIQDNNDNILLNTFYDGYYYNKNHRNEIKNDYDYCHKNDLLYFKKFITINNYKFSILINKNVVFNVILLSNDTQKITIQVIIQGVNINDIKNIHQFVFINNNNHTIVYLNLKDVFNKIIDIFV
jgi:mannosyltransferase OCH1-like enzyme